MSRSNPQDEAQVNDFGFSAFFCYNRDINEVEYSKGKRFIYKIMSPSNSVYIGQTTNATRRMARYRLMDCKEQKRLFYSISKYGWENHSVEMIDLASNQEDLYKKEVYWISHYRSRGYDMLNLTNGGRCVPSKRSEDAKLKMSLRLKGKKGHPRTEVTKEKLRRFNKGKTLSEEHKQKISIAHKGRKMSKHVMDKLREGHKNHTRTIAENYNCRIAISKPIYCFETDTHYDSISEAGRLLGINKSSIYCGMKRKQEKICGYRFKYSDMPKKPFYKTKNNP